MEIEEKDLNYLKRSSKLYSLSIALGVFSIVVAIIFYGLALNFGLNSGKLAKNIFPEFYQACSSKWASLGAVVPATELEKRLIVENKKNLMVIYDMGEFLLRGTVFFLCFFSFVWAFWSLVFGIVKMRISRIVDRCLSKSPSVKLTETKGSLGTNGRK